MALESLSMVTERPEPPHNQPDQPALAVFSNLVHVYESDALESRDEFDQMAAELEERHGISVGPVFLRELAGFGVIDISPYHDDGKKPVRCAFILKTDRPLEAGRFIVAKGYSMLMLGGLSSSTGNFSVPLDRSLSQRVADLIGIQPKIATTVQAKAVERSADIINLEPSEGGIKSNQIFLDDRYLYAGCGVTFAAVQETLDVRRDEQLASGRLSEDFEECLVPRPTSYKGATIGASLYAKGANRLDLTRFAVAAQVFDGREIKVLNGADIATVAGMWGMTGVVGAVQIEVIKRPRRKGRFFVALKNQEALAAVQKALTSATQVDFSDGTMKSQWEHGVVEGIEVANRTVLELTSRSSEVSDRRVKQKCKTMGEYLEMCDSTTGLMIDFRTMHRDFDDLKKDPEGPYLKLCELARQGLIHFVGLENEDGEGVATGEDFFEEIRNEFMVFNDAAGNQLFEEAREALPKASRRYGNQLQILADRKNSTTDDITEHTEVLSFTVSTDFEAFIDRELDPWTLSADELMTTYTDINGPGMTYGTQIDQISQEALIQGINVINTLYGHANPVSVNPHDRVTVSAEVPKIYEEERYSDLAVRARLMQTRADVTVLFNQVKARIIAAQDELSANVRALPRKNSNIAVAAGEKGWVTQEGWAVASNEQRRKLLSYLAGTPEALQCQMLPQIRKELDRYLERSVVSN